MKLTSIKQIENIMKKGGINPVTLWYVDDDGNRVISYCVSSIKNPYSFYSTKKNIVRVYFNIEGKCNRFIQSDVNGQFDIKKFVSTATKYLADEKRYQTNKYNEIEENNRMDIVIEKMNAALKGTGFSVTRYVSGYRISTIVNNDTELEKSVNLLKKIV